MASGKVVLPKNPVEVRKGSEKGIFCRCHPSGAGLLYNADSYSGSGG